MLETLIFGLNESIYGVANGVKLVFAKLPALASPEEAVYSPSMGTFTASALSKV